MTRDEIFAKEFSVIHQAIGELELPEYEQQD
jgi:hypothetical protein